MKCKFIGTLATALIISGCSGLSEQPIPDRPDLDIVCYSNDAVIVMGKDIVLTRDSGSFFSVKALNFLEEQDIIDYNHFRLNSKAYFNYDEQSYYLSVSSNGNEGWMKDINLKKIDKYKELSFNLDEREVQLKEWMCRP